MKVCKWNEDWKFWSDKDAFALVWNIPENAADVTLPHDAMIEKPAYAESPNGGNTGFRDGGNYTYVKLLDLTEEEASQKHIIKFDGAYCHALVYVNEQLAGGEAYGYSVFYVDITPWLCPGTNEIRVQVKNAGMTNSRWYSGSGIYRDVYMMTSGATYIEPDMVQVTTENADEDTAVLSVKTTIINESLCARNLVLSTAVCDADGNEAGYEKTAFFMKASESKTITQCIVVKAPKLWSEGTPALYGFDCRLCDGESVLDSACGRFGIRTLSLDAARGFRVNGQEVKLRGACIHHDSGIIGAATYKDAQLRQIRLLKEAGFNAIRMSHHPAAPALLDACDELGMYVMDEFSDMWTRTKSDLDYALDFEKWWETDVTLMVRKNFNHPSVVLHSVGNEIPEIGTDFGSDLCARISGLFKSLDPTRYTTAGINGVFAAGDQMGRIMADLSKDMQAAGEIEGNVNDFMTVMDTKMDQIVVHDAISERLEKACASLDVAGYNYMTARYEKDCVTYPNRVMVGSETYPPDIARNWGIIKRLPCTIGDFTWTGWDYIGEAGVGVPAYRFGEGGFGAQFPCQLAYCGDIDLTGFRRPASYFREVVFGLRKDPYIAVQDPHHYGEHLIKTPWVISDAVSTWTWGGYEDKPVIVEVYSDADEVELFVNGKSVGKSAPEGCIAKFETEYVPGTVTAKSYIGGNESGSHELKTAGEAAPVVRVTWEGDQLVYADVQLEDADGNIATDRDIMLAAEISGAKLLGFGSGNPKPLNNYNEGRTMTFNGRAQLILLKDGDGEISINVAEEH